MTSCTVVTIPRHSCRDMAGNLGFRLGYCHLLHLSSAVHQDRGHDDHKCHHGAAHGTKKFSFFSGRATSVMVPLCPLFTSTLMLGKTRLTISKYSFLRYSCTNRFMMISNSWHWSSRAHRRKPRHIAGSCLPQYSTMALSLLW